MVKKKRAPKKLLTDCIGCGKPPPTRGSKALRKLWQTRTITLAGEPMLESSCPVCFRLYGWGDELTRTA